MKARTNVARKVRDPVCGMRFRAKKATATVQFRGRTVHFCTDACRRQFERDPERYAGTED